MPGFLRALCLFVFLLLPVFAQAQEPSQEQAMRNNMRMLEAVRENPDAKPRILEKMRERLSSRGVQDLDSKIAAVSKILDEAAAMSDADFKKSEQQLASRIIAQVKGEGGLRQSASFASEKSSVPWIDGHVHFIAPKGDYDGAMKDAVSVMGRTGASMMIVMPAPNDGSKPVRDYESFLPALRQQPSKFAFLGGGSSLNAMIHQAKQGSVSASLRKQFEEKAAEILKAGASGFGEMAIHHLSLHGSSHPYESVPADHPLFLLLADIAAKANVPIDVHFDLVAEDTPVPDSIDSPNNPKTLKANLAPFERFLDRNPKAKICWAHAGSDNVGHWTTELSRRLLKAHPNLYMSLRLGPGHFPQNFPLSQDGELRPEWLALFKEFPTRFYIGDDQFFLGESAQSSGASAFSSKAPLARKLTAVFLKALPPELASKIASENVAALYKLKAKSASDSN